MKKFQVIHNLDGKITELAQFSGSSANEIYGAGWGAANYLSGYMQAIADLTSQDFRMPCNMQNDGFFYWNHKNTAERYEVRTEGHTAKLADFY